MKNASGPPLTKVNRFLYYYLTEAQERKEALYTFLVILEVVIEFIVRKIFVIVLVIEIVVFDLTEIIWRRLTLFGRIIYVFVIHRF